MDEKMKWTAIVLTCVNRDWTHAMQTELEIRKKKGFFDKDTIVLTVEDPKSSVGSGGATINALLTVTEYISAVKGYTVINADVLNNSKILILHSAKLYPYSPCGRTLLPLPVTRTAPEYEGLLTNIDLLIANITEKLAIKSAPGVWVSSTDMLLSIPNDPDIHWEDCDACALTVPASPKYCRNHGVYKINAEGYVEDILYQKDMTELEKCERADGSVPVVCAVLYMGIPVVERLLTFHTKPPLDACTYLGVDSGQSPIQLSLFFDIMLSMCSDISETDFVEGARSGIKGQALNENGDTKVMKSVRRLLWKELHEFRLKTCMVEKGEFHYLESTALDYDMAITECPLKRNFSKMKLTWKNIVHSHVQDKSEAEEGCILMNTILSGNVNVCTKTIISDCLIYGKVEVGRQCLLTGLKIEDYKMKKKIIIAEYMVLQGFRIHLKTLSKTTYVLTTHGKFDRVDSPMWKSTSTFCNGPWVVFLNRTGILKEELWGTSVASDDQNVLTAKLFPVFHATENVGLPEILWLQGEVEDEDNQILQRWRSSWRLSLSEILNIVDIEEELRWKNSLFYDISQRQIERSLNTKGDNTGFRSVYKSARLDGASQDILKTLDKVAKECISAPGVAARTLANIADLLGCMAGDVGGLRSGPAANKSWTKAFHLLEMGNLCAGVDALAKERENWLDRPDKLVRAARHYEGAAQILIRQAVMTGKKFFKPDKGDMVEMGKWVVAESPVRIDVAGGWSDTPPITYEHGGAVTTIGLKINGKRPVGAKCKRIEEPKIVMVLIGLSHEPMTVVCDKLSDMEDYCQPHSPGALLKAAFVCADIVCLSSEKSLKDQLMEDYGGGFEIHSWSNLPHGSGMGTSSILAGAVVGVLLRAAGKSCDKKGLIHAVLYLEQLLTTGGGWQDQVGGLLGGIHIGLSEAKLPLYIDAVNLNPSEEVIQAINDKLVLVYTGKTRLARNLLQDVVRNWYARNPNIVQTEDRLVILAQECATAFIDKDFEAVGNCLNRYWELKKCMAPGCETERIKDLIDILRPFVYGICAAGAGGGGFMFAIAKDKSQKDLIRNMLPAVKGASGSVMYEGTVDTEGLQIWVED